MPAENHDIGERVASLETAFASQSSMHQRMLDKLETVGEGVVKISTVQDGVVEKLGAIDLHHRRITTLETDNDRIKTSVRNIKWGAALLSGVIAAASQLFNFTRPH